MKKNKIIIRKFGNETFIKVFNEVSGTAYINVNRPIKYYEIQNLSKNFKVCIGQDIFWMVVTNKELLTYKDAEIVLDEISKITNKNMQNLHLLENDIKRCN